MRIVFVNMHQTEFLMTTLSKLVFRQSVALKHKYLLNYLLNSDIEVCNYVNPNGGTFSRIPIIGMLMQNLRFWEHRYILRKNEIDHRKITLLRNIDKICPDDIVIGYRHVPSSLADMKDIHAFKVVHMIHFHGEQSDSDLIKNANPDLLINESDLSRSSEIFRRYYSWYKGDFLVHPFVAAPRFKRIKPFSERENRCFSTGTITYKIHPEFLEVYGDPCDQPTRKQILANAESLKQYVACYNSDYLEDTDSKKYLPTDSFFTHYYKVWYNLTHTGHQKKYFSFDMVEKFNDFKMCLVGEEILGVPGIGFVEGMCCGCAYIGQRTGYYESYGMVEGVHYIGYDGTLEDLKHVITFYQQPENQNKLEQIANAGYEFAQEHFRGDKVAKFLIDSMMDRKSNRKNNKIN